MSSAAFTNETVELIAKVVSSYLVKLRDDIEYKDYCTWRDKIAYELSGRDVLDFAPGTNTFAINFFRKVLPKAFRSYDDVIDTLEENNHIVIIDYY